MDTIKKLMFRKLQMHKWTWKKWLVVSSFLVIFYIEFLSYYLQSWMWPRLKIDKSDSKEQLKVLFVADPQLQGYLSEPPTLGYITRWDIDRYLKKTFQIARNYFNPDVIIFMGDLLDEGSIASNADYETYYKRFMNIYQTESHVKHLYIPGDNDVGGEGFDHKDPWKMTRFQEHFKQSSKNIHNVKFLDFLMFSYDFGSSYDKKMQEMVKDMMSKAKGDFHVILNHMGILQRYKYDVEPVMKDTDVSLIITAHSHQAALITCADCKNKKNVGQTNKIGWKGVGRRMNDYTVYSFNLKSELVLNEIVIPTCSYRMGVPEMGFGAAVIDPNGGVKYTVLWNPPRYKQLYYYLIYMIVVLVFVMVKLLLFVKSLGRGDRVEQKW